MINMFKEIKFYKCKFLDEFNGNIFRLDQKRSQYKLWIGIQWGDRSIK